MHPTQQVSVSGIRWENILRLGSFPPGSEVGWDVGLRMLCLLGQKNGFKKENHHLETGRVCPGKEKWPWAGSRIESSTLAGERSWKVSGSSGWLSPGLLCTSKSRCCLGSEPQVSCEEPKRPKKPSEKQPTGVPPGTLPDPMAHPLPRPSMRSSQGGGVPGVAAPLVTPKSSFITAHMSFVLRCLQAQKLGFLWRLKSWKCVEIPGMWLLSSF